MCTEVSLPSQPQDKVAAVPPAVIWILNTNTHVVHKHTTDNFLVLKYNIFLKIPKYSQGSYERKYNSTLR